MNTSGRHFPKEVILTTIRWYLRYNLSYRDIEELIAERGIALDHSTLNRWVIRYTPGLVTNAQKHKRRVGVSWRFDETYIKVRGQWKYLYRAVDKDGDTIDFLLTAKRDAKAALRFLRQAIRNNVTPLKINIDKSDYATHIAQRVRRGTRSSSSIPTRTIFIVAPEHRKISAPHSQQSIYRMYGNANGSGVHRSSQPPRPGSISIRLIATLRRHH